MKITLITRLLPAVGFACVMGLAQAATAQTTTATGSMAPVSTMASAPTKAPAKTAMTKPVAAKLAKADEFTTATAAAAHCPSDTVVWASTGKSKAFHVASSKFYGKTKHGAYVCQADATAAGLHQAKN